MKDFKIYVIVASVLFLIYLVAQFDQPTPTNWSPTFYYDDKIPFGTYVTYNRLKDIFPASEIKKTNNSIYREFHDSIKIAGSYLIIAKTVKTSQDDFNELVKYIKKGNSVFISAFNIRGFLADTLGINVGDEVNGNPSLSFINASLNPRDTFSFTRDISNQYFSDFDTAKAVALGKNSYGHVTFLNFKFGAGNLYLCTNPAVFSNFSVLTNDGATYASKALSYLPITKNIYWDEFQNGDIPPEQSPMRVFFSKPSLQWAYYLSLFGLIVYVIFEMKRRQRIIPVIEPLANSTLDFVNVVGQVYYEKRDNTNIAHKKILYFLEQLRDQYQIRTTNMDNEFIEKLKKKLGIEASLAQEFVEYIHYIDVQVRVTDNELIKLNKLIEKLNSQFA